MTASSNIKTPYMEITLVPTATQTDALRLCQILSKLTLSAIIDKVVVKQSLSKAVRPFLPLPLNVGSQRPHLQGDDLSRGRVYEVELHIMAKEDLKRKHKITQDQVSVATESLFLRKLLSLIAQRLKINKASDDIGVGVSVSKFNEVMSSTANEDDEAAEKAAPREVDDDADGDDGDATAAKIAKRKKQAASYEDDDAESGDDEKDSKPSAADKKKDDEDSSDETEDGEPGKADAEIEIEEMEVVEDEAPAESSTKATPSKKTPKKAEKAEKAEAPKKTSPYERVSGFYFDKETNVCHFSLKYPVNLTKLLMVSEIEKAADATVLREVKGINRAFIEKNEQEEDLTVTFSLSPS